MKQSGKISKLPLWIADGLMFVCVLIMAVPTLRYGEPMGALQTLFCCALVAAAMAMILLAYKFDRDAISKEKSEEAEEAKKNWEIIFEELSALRMMLVDANEKIENLEFGAEDSKRAAEKLSGLEAGVLQMRDSLVKKFKDISASVESAAKRADDISAKNCAMLKKDLADFNVEFLELRQNFAKNAEQSKREIAELSERIEGLEESLETFSSEDGPDEDEFSGAEQAELNGVLERALSKGSDVAATVGKFVSMSKPADESKQIGELDGADAPNEGAEDEGAGTVEEEFGTNAPGAQMGESSDGASDGPNISDLEDSDMRGGSQTDSFSNGAELSETGKEGDPEIDGLNPANKNKKAEFDGGVMNAQGENEDFFERADSGDTAGGAESAEIGAGEKVGQHANESGENFLFDDLPPSAPKKTKPTKRDAVIEVNALIGIGNKPYLRCNGAGLSMDRGVPMEFVEIGKWRYVLVEISEPLEFKILRNDKDAPNEEIPPTISAGERLELNLSFPQKEEIY